MRTSALGLLFLSLCLVLSACDATTDTSTDDAMMEEDEAMMEDDSMMEDEGVELMIEEDAMIKDDGMMEDDAMMEDEGAMMEGDTRVIAIDAANWLFSPNVITAKKGEKVRLELTSSEGIHGFAVPGLSMNVRIEPGKTVTVDLPTDVAGTFDAFCSIPCGTGHTEMKAKVVIG